MLEAELGQAQRYQSLTVFPLVNPRKRELELELLGDALAAGTLTITELGQGTVPELMVENNGETDVLVLDGEQLIGAKQNRMTNRSLILPARSKTRIPVSCMEHGRWHTQTARFSHGLHYSPSKVRRHARRHEAAHAGMAEAADPCVLAGAQGDVWNQIADYSAQLGAGSETGALDHLYEARSLDLEAWTKRFPWVDDQIGILAFLGDQPLGMDVVGGHRLYARLHRRLVSGYVMDAFAAREAGNWPEPSRSAAERFRQRVDGAARTRAPTVGKGTYGVLSGDVVGGELGLERRLAHLSAFPIEDPATYRGADVEGPPMAPPSRRRRML